MLRNTSQGPILPGETGRSCLIALAAELAVQLLSQGIRMSWIMKAAPKPVSRVCLNIFKLNKAATNLIGTREREMLNLKWSWAQCYIFKKQNIDLQALIIGEKLKRKHWQVSFFLSLLRKMVTFLVMKSCIFCNNSQDSDQKIVLTCESSNYVLNNEAYSKQELKLLSVALPTFLWLYLFIQINLKL